MEAPFYVRDCRTNCVWEDLFCKQFLQHLSDIMIPIPSEVIWCYGEWQPGYETVTGVTFVEGLPKAEEWHGDNRRLVIVDDLMSETDERVTKLFTKGSHHRNLSVMYLVQNLFGKNKEQLTISLNSHYLIVFDNPRDASQIVHLAKQMYPGRVKYMQKAFKSATSEAHGYLLIDLKQDTLDHLRLRTGLFPGDQHVVYVQK